MEIHFYPAESIATELAESVSYPPKKKKKKKGGREMRHAVISLTIF